MTQKKNAQKPFNKYTTPATGLRLEDLREAVQDSKKWRTLVEEKTQNRECINVK
jgi:hypothetical protein